MLLLLVIEGVSLEEHLLVVLLSGIDGVVDESEASGSATTELELKTEDGNALGISLEHLGELLLDLGLGNVDLGGVDDLDSHLLSAEEGVVNLSLGEDGDITGLFVGAYPITDFLSLNE